MVENSYYRCKALGSVPNTRGRRERLGIGMAQAGGGGWRGAWMCKEFARTR